MKRKRVLTRVVTSSRNSRRAAPGEEKMTLEKG